MNDDADFAYNDAMRRRIAGNLGGFERLTSPPARLKRAAVAIAVVDDGSGRAAFVLTRRSHRLRAHTGQWALPGGRIEAHESTADGVLRELCEEVNLQPAGIEVLGTLDDYPTRSGYLITPLVVWLPPDAQMTPNPDEVSAIHRVPLDELERPGSPEFAAGPERDRLIIRVPIHDHHIHAPTGAVLYQFREVALHGRATRVRQYGEPVWAWR